MQNVKTFKTDSLKPRILLLFGGLLVLFFLLLAMKWFFGNAIANRLVPKEVAELAVSLAPNDPQTHLSVAGYYEQTFQPDDLPKSLTEYEKAVALSPNDYRLWLAYGKALERNGDTENAVKAFQKVLQLAPNYAEVHWAYGNILLRQDKTTEAFAEIRRAVEGDSKFAAPAATTAWNIFQGNLDEVKKNIGNSAPARSALAVFLSNEKRFDEALEIWKGLPASERKNKFKEEGNKILEQLITNKKYRTALPLKVEFGDKVSIGKITNGGFENEFDVEKPQVFQWEFVKGEQPAIGLNNEQKHGGKNSLVLVFNSPVGKDFRNISQIVAVESGQDYQFQAFYRADLKTSATVKWEIVEAASGKVLATTKAIEKKSNWTNSSVEFTTAEDSEGVIIRLVRENCTSADCSISGTVWFDDISLN